MPASVLRICAALLIVLCLVPTAHADVTFPDLGEAVPGIEGTRYIDLVRLVVPDLESVDGAYRGHKVIDVRHLGGDDMKSSPPDTLSFFHIAVLPIRADGKERLLILLDLGQGAETAEGFAVLALYSLAGGPKLLDATGVGYDQSTNFRYPESLSLGDGKDIALTMSMHFNSSQAYVTSAMILVRNDRLQLIDTVFTFDDRYCAFDRRQVPEFRAGDRDGRIYSDIVVTVTEATTPTGETCDAEEGLTEGQREITATYRWDEASSRFVAGSDALKLLAKENETRF